MKLKPLFKGLISFLPKSEKILNANTGGTDSARYCYSVWLRHLKMAYDNGCLNTFPQYVAELGPGDSLGIGLAALLSGVKRYYAFDIVNHTTTERDLKVFEELVSLFKNKEPIPDENEFPKVKPILETYQFPNEILTDDWLKKSLESNRVNWIKNSLLNSSQRESPVKYKAPWHSHAVMEKESVDMIFSQATLEHVDDLVSTYEAMNLWLKPGGCMSHKIDFKYHGTAGEWNGHWLYSDFMWKLIRGKRPYLLNREPYSTHRRLLSNDFKIVFEKTYNLESQLTPNMLSARFKEMTIRDLNTSGLFVQAIKS